MLFTEQDLKKRFSDIYAIAVRFCEVFGDEFCEECGAPPKVDPGRLYLTVTSAFDDIARYKTYHLKNPSIQKSSAIKRAAFLTKWILHFSPLVCDVDALKELEINELGEHVLINTYFALHLAFTNIQDHSGSDFALSSAHYYELVYDLTYRGLSAEALILHYQTLSELLIANDLSGIFDST